MAAWAAGGIFRGIERELARAAEALIETEQKETTLERADF